MLLPLAQPLVGYLGRWTRGPRHTEPERHRGCASVATPCYRWVPHLLSDGDTTLESVVRVNVDS
jgi:hypothetical protein